MVIIHARVSYAPCALSLLVITLCADRLPLSYSMIQFVEDHRSLQMQLGFHTKKNASAISFATSILKDFDNNPALCYGFRLLQAQVSSLDMRYAFEHLEHSDDVLHLFGAFMMEEAIMHGDDIHAVIYMLAGLGTTYFGLGGPVHGAVWHYMSNCAAGDSTSLWLAAFNVCEFFFVNAMIPLVCLHGMGHGVSFRIIHKKTPRVSPFACMHQVAAHTHLMSIGDLTQGANTCLDQEIRAASDACAEGLMMTYVSVTVSSLQNCDGFSVQFAYLCVFYMAMIHRLERNATMCYKLRAADARLGCHLSLNSHPSRWLFNRTSQAPTSSRLRWGGGDMTNHVQSGELQLYVNQKLAWFFSLSLPPSWLQPTEFCNMFLGPKYKTCRTFQLLRTASFPSTKAALIQVPYFPKRSPSLT